MVSGLGVSSPPSLGYLSKLTILLMNRFDHPHNIKHPLGLVTVDLNVSIGLIGHNDVKDT